MAIHPAYAVTIDEIECTGLYGIYERWEGPSLSGGIATAPFGGLKLEASEYCGRVNITRLEYGSAPNKAIGGKL